MRDAAEIREFLIQDARNVYLRASMYASTGQAMQGVLGGLLSQLCFIDEKEHEASALPDPHWYGKLGVAGPFLNTFGQPDKYAAEVAGVYAERLHTLGYVTLDRAIDAAEFADLTEQVRERFEERDLRRSEVESLIGPPSLIVDRRVSCYASSEPGAGWIFFDYWDEPIQAPYEAGTGRRRRVNRTDDDPLLRDVRIPAETWEQALVLTLYGKFLRWGPSWWLDHRTRSEGADTDAIAAQLRGIREADPSQAQGRN